ncbi:MAG: NAD(P)H-hydrate dehydratase [Methanomassiliicoccaceae archaeon]|jgi:NAD(P)H-hydrate epimerase|nr:NAD(P)H-hydrate dehydratase [Methanomassiliicoccaceae archaeon]
MITQIDAKAIDVNCEALGVPIEKLMANAGKALYDVLNKGFSGKRILIVCGLGNNGGDGFACAKHFGKKANVALLFPPDQIKSAAARYHFEELDKKPMMFSDAHLDQYDVILDCVLGMGARSPLSGPYKDYIKRLKDFKGAVVATDVPTGFGTKDRLIPHTTVTFHDKKSGMTEENCGKIVIADIGIPKDALYCVGPGDMLRYPVPEEESHKGENGRLLVIGGGPYFGAPAISAMAAYRVGVDLVHVAAPKRCIPPMAAQSPMFILHETSDEGHILEQDVKRLLELAKLADAVLIGPGLGTSEDTMAAVREFVLRCDRPLVVDADAITAIANMAVVRGDIMITPHKKEFERISGFALKSCDLIEVSKKKNLAMLVKGRTDVIVHGDKKKINNTGTAAMTVGGTGDVLSGAVAGLLSKGMSLFDAACLGAYICGVAGEKAFEAFSYGMIATDVTDMIPKVLKDHLDRR